MCAFELLVWPLVGMACLLAVPAIESGFLLNPKAWLTWLGRLSLGTARSPRATPEVHLDPGLQARLD